MFLLITLRLSFIIQHIDNDELLYVGHTTDFNKRKCRHKANCNSCQFKVYQMIREMVDGILLSWLW